MIGGKNIPTDEKLYNSIKKKVKAKFQKTSRWPSAYGSGFLVKEYKKAFNRKDGVSTILVEYGDYYNEK